MATYKELINSSLSSGYMHLECDMCGSTDIVDTSEGYVCRECGIVLEIQKLQYYSPYNELLVQNAKRHGPTQIGTNRERRISPISERLNRLSKQNLIIPNEQAVIDRANVEISRIFSKLNLSDYDSIKHMVLEKFKEIRGKLRKGVKYRNTEKLVSIISYFCLKLRNVSVNATELIDITKITKKEFNDFCYQVRIFLPNYVERNRQEYILNRVFEITQYFNLGMEFFHLARKILKKLWHGIKNTTDNALAGLVCSISLLCSHNEGIMVSAICERLDIRMSTVQAQVKKKIIQKLRIKGFISLVKSSDLLMKIMEKLGLLEAEYPKVYDKVQEIDSEIVEVVLGNAEKVFNAIGHTNCYHFIIKGEENNLVFINICVYNFGKSSIKIEHPQGEAYINFMIYRYPLPTGPPL